MTSNVLGIEGQSSRWILKFGPGFIFAVRGNFSPICHRLRGIWHFSLSWPLWGVVGQRILKVDPGFIIVVHWNFSYICHRLLAITEKCIFGVRFPLRKVNMAARNGSFGGVLQKHVGDDEKIGLHFYCKSEAHPCGKNNQHFLNRRAYMSAAVFDLNPWHLTNTSEK